MGTVVGMLSIVLAVWAWRVETRRWVRWLAVSTLLAVILQGILGGLRVVLVKLDLAIVHACVGLAYEEFSRCQDVPIPTRWSVWDWNVRTRIGAHGRVATAMLEQRSDAKGLSPLQVPCRRCIPCLGELKPLAQPRYFRTSLKLN